MEVVDEVVLRWSTLIPNKCCCSHLDVCVLFDIDCDILRVLKGLILAGRRTLNYTWPMNLARFEMTTKGNDCFWARGEGKDFFSNILQIRSHGLGDRSLVEQQTNTSMADIIHW